MFDVQRFGFVESGVRNGRYRGLVWLVECGYIRMM